MQSSVLVQLSGDQNGIMLKNKKWLCNVEVIETQHCREKLLGASRHCRVSVKKKQGVKFGWQAGRLLLAPSGAGISKNRVVEKKVLSDIMF